MMSDLTNEKVELSRRMRELQTFIKSNECARLDYHDRDLLHRKHDAMSGYCEILQSQIERFKNSDCKAEESNFRRETANDNHLENAAPELFVALLLTIQTSTDCSNWVREMALSALIKAEPALKGQVSNWSRK